jgi:hypothetical protein
MQYILKKLNVLPDTKAERELKLMPSTDRSNYGDVTIDNCGIDRGDHRGETNID